MMTKDIPNFFLTGAVKSGTTSLYYYLQEHPEVYLCPIKEPHYFSYDDMDFEHFRPLIKERIKHFNIEEYLKSPMQKVVHRAYISNSDTYKLLYKNVKQETAIGEASTSYLWAPNAAKRIKEKNPDAKIIFLLRNPVERAFAHYLMDYKNGLISSGFADALQADQLTENPSWGKNSMYIETGMYARQVRRFTSFFPPEQYMFVIFERFVENPASIMKEIYRFLEVEDNFIPDFSKKYNASLLPKNRLIGSIFNNNWIRKYMVDNLGTSLKKPLKKLFFQSENLPAIKNEEKLMLMAIFEKDISILENDTGLDLTHWMK